MSDYFTTKKITDLPRIPFEGNIDLTYRCNNNCRHCWLWLPADAPEHKDELTFDEIRCLVDEARKLGCRSWSISGGEPMLREDFEGIFDYITDKSISYSINTNGTFITPKIAKLLKKRGVKMVALYGATADVHDYITRNPGSFEMAMQGFAYLKEAGAGFVCQITPMRDNYHQFNDMVRLAESITPVWRIGATWFHLSANGDSARNAEIKRQRLSPKDAADLDRPDLCYEEGIGIGCFSFANDRLFSSCINGRRDFHIDPYGKMTFCSFIKDPSLRYDLRKGSLEECWNKFIPSIADSIRGGSEYLENCGNCNMRSDCQYCPVYGWLEHRRFSARVDYLCDVARERRRFKKEWKKNHRRYFKIAGITIQVDSDMPITEDTFHPKFKAFEVDGPGEDNITIRHHFTFPDFGMEDLGKEVYHKPPWNIYKKGDSWIYLGIYPEQGDTNCYRIAVINYDHTASRIYSRDEKAFKEGSLSSLTLFTTDQILLARVLADREGCYLHSSGVIFKNKGLLFVGHSEAGKSTMVKMLKGKSEILCDDRVIVRRWPEGFRLHGTWSHGEVPDVSAGSAPLDAIFFLKKSTQNHLVPIYDKKDIIKRLLACLVRPLVDADWWRKMLSLIEKIADEIPCYTLYFDKCGEVVDLIKELVKSKEKKIKAKAV